MHDAPPPQEETNERKNALEAYVYDLRNKLCDNLTAYVREVGASR
jgi:heat shock protein 4